VGVRREVLLWTVAVGAVLLAFGVTVLALNLTVYSATGFVRSYLDALSRHDATTALELAGPAPAGDASDALLVREAMGDLEDIRITGERTTPDGTHLVTAEYVVDGEPGSTVFAVARGGTLFGVFNGWRFVQSPLAVLQLTVKHGDAFTANGVDLVAGAGQDAQTLYLAFAPSAIELTHESQYLTAKPVTAVLLQPGTAVPAVVDVRANEAFVAEVQRQIDDYLETCTTQHVLLPTGCPFGQTIDDRVASEPVWTMVQDPAVTLEPAGAVATWRVPNTGGVAHLVVDVQSLFDGSISTFDEDVPFSVSYDVTFIPGDILISAVG
jgi:hypothetical protein